MKKINCSKIGNERKNIPANNSEWSKLQKAFTQVWKVELQVKSTAYKHKVIYYKNTHTQTQSQINRDGLYTSL